MCGLGCRYVRMAMNWLRFDLLWHYVWYAVGLVCRYETSEDRNGRRWNTFFQLLKFRFDWTSLEFTHVCICRSALMLEVGIISPYATILQTLASWTDNVNTMFPHDSLDCCWEIPIMLVLQSQVPFWQEFNVELVSFNLILQSNLKVIVHSLEDHPFWQDNIYPPRLNLTAASIQTISAPSAVTTLAKTWYKPVRLLAFSELCITRNTTRTRWDLSWDICILWNWHGSLLQWTLKINSW